MALRAVLAVLLLLGIVGVAGGQGAVGYDPDVGTVFDGVVHDVRPTVSADLRYVQINVGSGMAVIIEIDDFQVITD
jgi:hypothetical protein